MNTVSRRMILGISSAWLLPATHWAADAAAQHAPVHPPLAQLEKKVGGRLGVALLDTGSGAFIGHRLQERFGMCSTFKLPLAAAILRKVDEGSLRLDQWVRLSQADIVPHSPVTQLHLTQGGMTVQALAEAAQTTSDNAAANLLLTLLGGPDGFTGMLRAAGDSVTRLDRMEPAMNAVPHGEVRDTTTPLAMAQTVSHQLTGGWLSKGSTAMLTGWMVATQTGTKRLRAGLPLGWRAGDKTGTGMAPGMPDKYNDVAIVWPPGHAPMIVAAYYETRIPHGGRMRDEDQAVLAQVGRIAAQWIRRS
jgi:beta-lactamase class A